MMYLLCLSFVCFFFLIKLEGVFTCNSDNIILRVPILYGPLEYLDESAVTTIFHAVQNTTKDCKINDVQRRFPTHTEDVAEVLKDIVQRRLQVLNPEELHHLHKQTPFSRRPIALAPSRSMRTF